MVAEQMQYSIDELELLTRLDSDSFDHFTQLARAIIGAPIALVSIIDEINDRQFFKGQDGLGEPWASRNQTPLSHSFCKYVVSGNAPLIVEDATQDPVVKHNLAIKDLGVIAYLGVPISNPGGEPIGALCAIDTSPRQWSDNNLQALKKLCQCVEDTIRLSATLKLARRQNDEQEQVTYAVSHDIRGPIRTIRLILDMLDGAYQKGDQELYANLMGKASKTAIRMQIFSDDILRFSVTKQDRKNYESVDLNALLSEICHDLDADFQEKSATIEIPDLPELTCDRVQTRMLFQNLISNAIKFSKGGTPPHIEMSHSISESYHHINIKDNGIGIAPEHQAKIFGLFERLHAIDSYDGTGLGLALCRRILENMNSEISVHSQEGKGATFTLRIPQTIK